MMTTEQLYEMMGQGNLGYACVFKKEDHGKHTDFMFPMTPKNIANFIGQNAFTADKIIMTDFCDRLICESIYGGFFMNCPDQSLCREIVPHLSAIQQGEKEAEQFPVATREEMQTVWDAEEAAVIGGYQTTGASTEYDEQLESLQRQMTALIEDSANAECADEDFDQKYRLIAEEIKDLKKKKRKHLREKQLADAYEQRLEGMDGYIKKPAT